MRPSQINAIDRIAMEAPVGVEDELCWFYGDLVGLERVSLDQSANELGFRSARIELRIEIKPEPRIEPTRRRALISVGSLVWVIEQLDGRGLAYVRLSGLNRTDRRVSLLDPAGNRVELKQEWRPGVASSPPQESRRGDFARE